MEKAFRFGSNCFFYANALGMCSLVVGFMKKSEERQNVMLLTGLYHFGFNINQYLLSYLRLRAFPHHLPI